MKKLLPGFLLVLLYLCAPVAAENTTGKDHMEIFKKFIEEGWNQGKEEVFAETIAPGCMFYTNGEMAPNVGPEVMSQAMKKNREDFPNFKMTIEDLFAGDDKIVCRYVFEGVFLKLKRPIKQHTSIIAQFAGGKIIKCWTYNNMLNLYVQLGFKLTPPPNITLRNDQTPPADASDETKSPTQTEKQP